MSTSSLTAKTFRLLTCDLLIDLLLMITWNIFIYNTWTSNQSSVVSDKIACTLLKFVTSKSYDDFSRHTRPLMIEHCLFNTADLILWLKLLQMIIIILICRNKCGRRNVMYLPVLRNWRAQLTSSSKVDTYGPRITRQNMSNIITDPSMVLFAVSSERLVSFPKTEQI